MFWLPTGFDRADGETNLPAQPLNSGGGTNKVGTPDPVGGVAVFSNRGSSPGPEEYSDSPEIERAEQATVEHRFRATWDLCKAYIVVLGRGTFLRDSFGNVWRVLSSKIKSSAGSMGDLSMVAESISFDSPPDDYQMIPVDLGLDIIKYPRYSWAISPYPSDVSTYTVVGDTFVYYDEIKESIIRAIQTYRDSPYFPSGDNINGLIQNNIMGQIKDGKIDVQIAISGYDPSIQLDTPPRWNGFIADLPAGNYAYAIVSVPVNLGDPNDPINISIHAAKEIISKLWRGEDTPPVKGFKVVWSQYYFAPVFENPGGYRESPIGIVPDYFLSPSQDGSNSIFDQMSSINPQCYSQDRLPGGLANISWLRESDEVEYQRTWFKVTRTWIGSPVGQWDHQLFLELGEPGPQDANDFV